MAKDKTKRREVSVGKGEAELIAMVLQAYWIQVPGHDADMSQEQAEFIELTERRWIKIAKDWKA